MTVVQELADRGRRATRPSAAAAAATAGFVLDTVGCAVAGAGHPLAAGLAASVAALHEGSTPSMRDRVATEATLAHVDELDALHTRAAVLPCATVVPVALELARHHEVTGPQLLGAVAAGAEVIVEAAVRFDAAALYTAGWWPTALFGGLGAAMAASTLLGHDEAATVHALALAASGLGGLLSADELAAGHYRLVGRAAADGLDAAISAGAGLRASSTVLDAPAAAALRRPAGPATSRDIPHLLDSTIKMFACARPLHAVIEALAELRRRGYDPTGAGLVRIGLPSATLRFVTAERRPAGPMEAAASAAYVLAAFLAGRADDPAFFRAVGPVEAPDVELVADPDLDARYPGQWGARVQLFGCDPASVMVDDARGGPGRAWTTAQRQAKFDRLVQPYWPRPGAADWAAHCARLPEITDSICDWARQQPVMAGWAPSAPS